MTAITRHPYRTAIIILVILLAAAGFLLWQGANSSTAASTSGTVEDFRDRMESEAPAEITPGIPTPGVYTFRQTGKETTEAGIATLSRSLPPEAVYVITPIAGGYHEDLRMSGEHAEEAHFELDAEGSWATWRRTKIVFLGIGTDDRDDVTPRALDHPHKMAVGDTWGGDYRQGDLEISYTAKVTGVRTVTIDDRPVKAIVYKTESTFAGSTPGTRTDVLAWAPSLRMPVAWTIDQKTGGSTDYEIHAELTLASAVPLT